MYEWILVGRQAGMLAASGEHSRVQGAARGQQLDSPQGTERGVFGSGK